MMKKLIEFLKTTALGGLFVLLPILLLYLLLAEALGLIVVMAEPIADLLPKGTFDEIKHPVAMGLILILGASFMIGLALRSEIGRRLGQWVEGKTIGRLPLYKAVKHLTGGFAGGESFQPALLKNSETEREIVYVIENHGNGQTTVLIPWAPTSFAGSVKIVARDRIDILDVSLGEVSRVLSQWGVGVRDLLDKHIIGSAP